MSNYNVNTYALFHVSLYFRHIFKLQHLRESTFITHQDKDDLVLMGDKGFKELCKWEIHIFYVQFFKGFHMTCQVLNKYFAFESVG